MQAHAIFAGKRPADDLAAWGYEPRANCGTLYSAAGATKVPAEQGRYHDHCGAFTRAVRDRTAPPVTAAAGIRTLAVLDAARVSAVEARSIEL